MTADDGGRPFLSRWARRKSAGKTAEPQEQAPAADAEAAARLTEEAANREAAERVDLETLDSQSDYEVFMKPGVPGDLRHQAFQRLWRSDPVFANLDRLNEYDEDFRTPIGAAALVRTAWRVGKGFLTEEDEAKPAEAAPPDAPTAEAVAETSGETLEAPPTLETEAETPPKTAERQAPPQPTPEEPRRVGLRARLDLQAFSQPADGAGLEDR
ncbi:MAG: DUF3306 domain-containing protein [Rhodospirillales bacterium]|nr:DUF3306 domain-containing protein [Rhodospirillales bacterium]